MTTATDRLQQAIALLQAGRGPQAADALEAICRIPPTSADEWFAQGVAQHWLGRLPAALAAFDATLARDAMHFDALNARGAVLHASNRDADAQDSYERALRLAPRHPQLLANLAIVLEAQGLLDAAVARYGEALAADPHCRPALINLVALLMRLDRAAEAHHLAERFAHARPGDAEAVSMLAATLLALDRYAEGGEAAERALAIDSTSIPARIGLAVAQACQGRFDASLASFRLAQAMHPAAFAQAMHAVWSHGDPARANWPRGTDALPDPRVIYLARHVFRLARCDWTQRDEFIDRLQGIVRDSAAAGAPVCEWALPFASTWLPLDDDVRLALASAVGRAVDRSTAPARLKPPSRRTSRPQRLRIGYLTPDAREHPNVTLTAPMIASHDRSRYEITGYVLGPPDAHPMAAEFRASCGRVAECHGRSDVEVARRIREDDIDILVDLAGCTEGARPEIAALHPARIQCTYLGNPGTTGGSWCDYRISDPIATPPDTQHGWTEQLALLPRSMFACAPVALSRSVPRRDDEGLPAGFVFCAFHTANKIDPTIFSTWMRLLAQVPGSVLWLAAQGAAAENLRRAAATAAIDPRRLVFAQRRPRREDHLRRLGLADLYLDVPRYNAHTTAVEALYAGVPVLTCTARGPASRVAASIVHEAGMDDLVVGTLDAYEACALRLATSPAALHEVRTAWQGNRERCRLFDPLDLAREIERACEHMWARWAAGLPPLAFRLEASSR